MTAFPFSSFTSIILRAGALTGLGLLLIISTTHRIGRDRLSTHGVVFLLNETSEVVGIELTEDMRYDGAIDDLATLETVTSVRMQNLICTDELLTAIAKLPNLNTLSLPGCTITDGQLNRLQHVRLSSIDLSQTAGPLKGIAGLGQQNLMKGIELRGCQWVSDADLRLLTAFPMLQYADMSETAITDDGVVALKSCLQLRLIVLSGCGRLSSTSLSHLLDCKTLKQITMHDVPLDLRAAAEFHASRPDVTLAYDQSLAPDLLPLIRPNPTELAMHNLGLEDRNSNAQGLIYALNADLKESIEASLLKYLPQLTSLRLTGTGVDDSIIPFIREMKSLKTLDLSRSRLSGPALCELPVFDQLQSVSLADTAVSVATLSWLAGLPDLRALDLSGTTISEDSSGASLSFPKVVFIDLSRADFMVALLTRIEAPNLKKIRLQACGLSDTDLISIADFPNLATLDLCENPLTGHGLASLRELPLTALRLRRTGLTEKGLESVSCLRNLTRLDVSGTTITGTGFRASSELPLDSIDLSEVKLSPEGVEAICQLKGLDNVNLQHAIIPEVAWRSLASGLRLRHVLIDAEPAIIQAFAEPQASTRLTTLVLNGPDRDALHQIGQFPAIGWLGLTHCELDEMAAEIIAAASQCMTLDLLECTVSNEAMQVLASSETLQWINLYEVDSSGIDAESMRRINPHLQISFRTPLPSFYDWEQW